MDTRLKQFKWGSLFFPFWPQRGRLICLLIWTQITALILLEFSTCINTDWLISIAAHLPPSFAYSLSPLWLLFAGVRIHRPSSVPERSRGSGTRVTPEICTVPEHFPERDVWAPTHASLLPDTDTFPKHEQHSALLLQAYPLIFRNKTNKNDSLRKCSSLEANRRKAND